MTLREKTRKCPQCGAIFVEGSNRPSIVAAVFAANVLSEIAVWVLAGLIAVVFVLVGFDLALLIATVVVASVSVILAYGWRGLKCKSCAKLVSARDLHEYNKSLNDDAASGGAR